MKVFTLLSLLLVSLVIATEEIDKRLFDDIEHHDEFNVADVDGIGFDRLEMEMRKRNIPIPPSMRQSGGDVNKH